MNFNNYYAEYFGGKQEKIKVFYEELKLPEDDPIHTLKEIIKEGHWERMSKQCLENLSIFASSDWLARRAQEFKREHLDNANE